MSDKKDIAYQIIHKSFDDNEENNQKENVIEETSTIEETVNYCSHCGAKVSNEDNFCKACGYSIKGTIDDAMGKDLRSITLLIVIPLVIAGFILLTPIECEANFLGLTIHPKIQYSILEQCIRVDIGAMSFKKENVSISDYATLKYKYLTNKKEFEQRFRSFGNY